MASPVSAIAPDRGDEASLALRASETRERLLTAALRLMSDQPWTRVSARAVAQAAGLDPALVTYHFGGRAGLVAAVAERATAQLRAQMHLEYDQRELNPEAFRAAVMDAFDVMHAQPLLAQLYVDELLLHGSEHTDEMLHALADPYFASIHQLVEHARRQGMLKPVPDDVIIELLTCLSLVYFFLSAALRRHPGKSRALEDAKTFMGEVVDLVLDGCLLDTPRRERVGKRSLIIAADDLDRDEIVDAAIQMLRQHTDAELSHATVAAHLGQSPSAVLRVFPSRPDLLESIARAAVGLLTSEVPQGRSPGRPKAENPELRADLLRAAAQLIEHERKAVTARAVASAAGCDPALVTYYFGSRRGLLQALAEEAISDLHSALLVRLVSPGHPVQRMQMGMEAVVRQISRRPGLAHVLLDEFLIHGTEKTDKQLHQLVMPGVEALQTALDESEAAGHLRNATRPALLFLIAALPAFVVAAAPTIGRALGGPTLAVNRDEFIEGIMHAVFGGIVVTDGGT